MQKIGFHHLYTFMDGPMAKPGSDRGSSVMLLFHFEQDLLFLFPYINAMAEKAELHENPNLVRFVFKDVHCVIYPERCIASPLKDRDHAKEFTRHVIDFLNEILERKEEIVPKFKIFKKIPVTDILKLLPITNCGECGYVSCMAFAAMLSKQQTQPSNCPYVGRPMTEQNTYPVHDNTGKVVSSVTLDIDTSNEEDIFQKEKVKSNKNKIFNEANKSLPQALTKRELEVLGLMASGQTNREISEKLFISPHTVKSHVIHIFNKLGVNHRTQAVVWAVRHELI